MLDIAFDLRGPPCPAWAALPAAEGGRGGNPWGTGAGIEQRATDEQQGRGTPAHVERRPQLTLVWRRHVRVVEIPDNGVGGPADGHEVEEARDDKDGAGDAGQARLQTRVAHALGALDAQDAQGECQAAEEHREHGEATGRLHVAGQSQQAVIHLALDLTGALDDAVHPQALPRDLRRHNVVAYEGGDAPHGEDAHQKAANPADDGQDYAQKLHARGRHNDGKVLVANKFFFRSPKVSEQSSLKICRMEQPLHH